MKHWMGVVVLAALSATSASSASAGSAAATVFDDPFSVAFPDPDHSVGESRFLIIGMSALHRVLVVSYAELAADLIRIISARNATRHERTFYEEDSSNP